ncbi:MAG: HPr family phosphocarrier protein, partial [Gammaproteobacteria bacterium]|nr:HPr family phosphocarrier protein [Gammaproteobacteria bacterium]
MIEQHITIINKLGLHARAAMKLINEASRFQSDIIIHYKNHKVNAKSILNVMSLGASKGAELTLTA